ncbi:MAG: hypothetical protein AAGK04_09865 [Planctomycetota bacterium]
MRTWMGGTCGLGVLAALTLCAGTASAQVASQVFAIGDIKTTGADGSLTSGDAFAVLDTGGVDLSRDFVAWRVRASWSVASGGPFSAESRVSMGGLADVAPVNGETTTSARPGLAFAGVFPTSGVLGLSSYDVRFRSGVFGEANFDRAAVEWFTREDLPRTLRDPGTLSGSAPAQFTDLGAVGEAGGAMVLDTIGSGFDTAMAVYAADGSLVDLNDDAVGMGGLESRLDLSGDVEIDSSAGLSIGGLGEGTYFVAVSEFDAVFAEDFDVAPRLEAGDAFDVRLNVNGVSGTQAIALGASEVAYFRFEVVPAPASLAALGVACLGGTRRRRAV